MEVSLILRSTEGQEALYVLLTLQNWMPLTELPYMSSGGDQRQMPITFGTTSIIPPETPDLAGRPTWRTERELRSDPPEGHSGKKSTQGGRIT